MNGSVNGGGGAGLIPGFVGGTLDRADAWRGAADRMAEAAGMLSARLLRVYRAARYPVGLGLVSAR